MQVRIKANMQAPRIQHSSYEKAMEKLGREVLSQAVFEYIVTVQGIVPIWTGASITTLSELANLIGMPIIVSATGSAALRPNLVNSNQSKAKATSGGSLKNGGGVYSFSYHTALPHLVYNEYNNANVDRPPELFSQLKNPGPYNFQAATTSAVLVVLKQFHLPDPRDHTKITKVSI